MRRSSRPLRGVCRAERHFFCPGVVGAHRMQVLVPPAPGTVRRVGSLQPCMPPVHAQAGRRLRSSQRLIQRAQYWMFSYNVFHSASRNARERWLPIGLLSAESVVWSWHARPVPPMQAAMRACTRPCGGAVRHVRGVRCFGAPALVRGGARCWCLGTVALARSRTKKGDPVGSPWAVAGAAQCAPAAASAPPPPWALGRCVNQISTIRLRNRKDEARKMSSAARVKACWSIRRLIWA